MTKVFRERTGFAAPSYPRFEPGATEASMARAERAMGVVFPEAHRALLAECDGIMDVMVLDEQSIDTGWLTWPIAAIVEAWFDPDRKTLGPSDGWLAFANAGADGILFVYEPHDAHGRIWA